MNLFLHELKQYWKVLLFWSIGILAMIGGGMGKFDVDTTTEKKVERAPAPVRPAQSPDRRTPSSQSDRKPSNFSNKSSGRSQPVNNFRPKDQRPTNFKPNNHPINQKPMPVSAPRDSEPVVLVDTAQQGISLAAAMKTNPLARPEPKEEPVLQEPEQKIATKVVPPAPVAPVAPPPAQKTVLPGQIAKFE
jgi:hypothetical protein